MKERKKLSQPIRVLQVVTQMHRAGLETILMNYYRSIDRTRIQFDFLVHREGHYDYDDEISELGGNIYHIRAIKLNDFGYYLWELKNFFAKHREYKIVHCHLDALSGFVLSAAKYAGIPIRIAHSHNNGFEQDRKKLRYFAKKLIPYVATDFWGCSEDAIRFMFGDKVIDSRGSYILPDAISLEMFQYSSIRRETMRKQLGLEGKFIIGHIGRFVYQKNHAFLLSIFADLQKRETNAQLILIGTGALDNEIKNLTYRFGIEKSVHFLGTRSDIPDLLCAMDVFVLPSKFEGLGVVLLEAQAIGVPCIASDKVLREPNITGEICYLPLSCPVKKWVDELIRCKGKRNKNRQKLLDSRYNIKTSAQTLMELYEGMYQNAK